MNDTIVEEKTRVQILQFLPAAIEKALIAYQAFMEEEKEVADSKKFGEHQRAGRIAIAHVELLYKLAARMEMPFSGEDAAPTGPLLLQAKASSDEYRAAHPDDDEDLA